MKLFSLSTINPDSLPYRDRDYYLYFIHLIVREQLNRDLDRSEYTSISSQAIADILHKKYVNVREYLKNTGLIESDNYFVIGSKDGKTVKGKCYGFRIAEHFRHGKIVYIEAGEKISSRIQAMRVKQIVSLVAKKIETNLIELETNPLVYGAIEREHAQDLIDLLQNPETLKSRYPLKYKIDPNGKRYITGKDYSNRIECKYESAIHKMNSIANKDFYVIEDSKAKRVHTNLTNCSKKHRQFLSARGNPLSEIDLRNSQPFLLSVLAYQFYGANVPKDVKEFLEICSQGMFYEFLMDKMNYTGDRDSFKVATFANIVFAESRYKKSRFEFEKLFPNVSNVIDHYKKADYRNLAIVLQKLERNLIIDKACNSIPNNIWFNPIHDSILTTQGNEELIKDILQGTIKEYCGVIPQVKINQLSIN